MARAPVTPPVPAEGSESATQFPNSCACNDLLTNAAFLRDPGMNTSTRKAIQIVLLNSIIAGMNGAAEYTLAELLDQGKCCSCEQFQALEIDAMWTYMLWALAARVGTVSDTPGELIEEACSLNCDPRYLDGIYIQLLCQFLKEVDDCVNVQ